MVALILRGLVVPLLGLLAAASSVAGQAPILLEPGHWTWDAVRRLSAAGLAPPASDPAAAPLTLAHARRVFTYAAAAAEQAGRPDLQRLAEGYAALLPPEDTAMLATAALRAGWLRDAGAARGGDGYTPGEDWEGARLVDDAGGAAALVDAHGWLHPRVGWRFDGGWIGDRWAVPAATVTAAIGAFDAWGGRRRLHYGAGRGGGTVLGSGTGEVADLAHRTLAAFDGLGVHVRDPFHFPWILRALGPSRIEIAAGRLAENGVVEAPYVVFGRLVITPFTPRLTLGVNRGAIFGGRGNPITLRRLAGLLFGEHGGDLGEFENQVISGVIRFRPPLGPIPLELYYERGADDTAGAIRDVPATVTGVDLAAVPGLPALALGVEHTYFAPSCCGNPPWYRNVFFRGSWGDRGRLFAHPLGGHGTEWLAHARLDLPRSGLLVRGEAFVRDRGEENLFAPEREGRSRGVRLAVDLRGAHRLQFRVDGAFEDGSNWSEQRISATVSHLLGRSIR